MLSTAREVGEDEHSHGQPGVRCAPQEDPPKGHSHREGGCETMQGYEFTVVIEKDEDGRFVAICPALQGC